MRVEVLAGAGTVDRAGAAVAWFAPGVTSATRAALTEILAAEAGRRSGAERIADRVAGILADPDRAASTAFALLVQSGDSVSVVIKGLVVIRDEDFVRLRGEVGDLLRRDLRFDRTLDVIGDRSHGSDVAARGLDAGSVPGGGFRLHADRPAEAELLRAPAAEAPETMVPPPEPPGDGASRPEAPIVEGRECARGHFNRPDARYCRLCGIAMVQRSRAVRGPRPPLGVLMSDSGTLSLNDDYVIGSEPSGDPAVRQGRARPLRLDDDSGQLAASHAKIVLRGWAVEVHDLGSELGTRIRNPGSLEWTQLPPSGSAVLEPGGQIAIAGKVIEYQMLHAPWDAT